MLRLLQRATTRALVFVSILLPSAALAQFGVPAPVTPAIPCPAFTGFPLALNLGTISLNGAGGIINRCAFQKTQAALNALSVQMAPLANPVFTGKATMPGLAFTGGPSIYQGGLVSNPRQTYTSLALQVNSAQPTTREFAAVFGLDATHGSAVTDPAAIVAGDADKGALFAGFYGRNGTVNLFGANVTTTVAPGNTSFRGAWGVEVDLENQAAHTGDAVGLAGLTSQPIARGLDITGTGASGTFRNTAAITIGAQQNPIWNRAIAISGTVQEDLGSYSGAVSMIRDWGNHVIGIDLSHGGYTQSAIRLGNQHLFEAMRADNTPAPLLSLSAANVMILGGTGIVGMNAQAPFNARQGLTAFVGTGTASTGQPSGTFAATVFNATNAAGFGGLFVKNQWGAAGTPVLEVGNDVPSGAYASYFTIDGGGTTILRKAVSAPALPTSAGTVKGTVCIDTTGALYVKTTTGACL